jgi:hypothetical protein
MDLEDVTIEQATVYTPRDGDIVILEVNMRLDEDELLWIKRKAEFVFEHGVKVVVLDSGAHFAGVVRDEESH